jgi:adenylate cyclase
MPEGTQRRLAAIVSADVVGYSRLMGVDEVGTLDAFRSHRFELIDPKISEYGGRIVKTMGDGLLLEFPSVVNATRCVIEIQQGMAERNEAIDDDQRIEFRVGINLGDIIIEGEDIHGDGVNIAARLQEIANPGGIVISQRVYEDVQDRLDSSFEDSGAQTLKNIARPVIVWRWSPGTKRSTTGAIPDSEPIALPDKPSIAVLPFDNLSGDPEQAFFADGMAEDIITGLSRFRSLFVTARNSTFAYKGQSPDVREVAKALHVRYILEGSVRRSGTRVRVTAQLIDAETGNHIWAERFDRELEDLFAIQDEVTEAIVAAIAPEIGEVERARAERKPLENLDNWDLFQRGLAAYYASTEAGLKSAIEQFDKVNENDPTFALAFAMAAGARWRHVIHFEPDGRGEILNAALEKVYRAIALDPRDATGLSHAGEVLSMLGQHDIAISKLEEAVALNPADAVVRYFLGSVLRRAGRPEEAIPHFDHAMRLSPRDIWITGMLTDRAFVLFDLGRYEEALGWAQRARLSPNPRTMTLAIYAGTLAVLGREKEARDAVDDLLKHAPQLTYTKYRKNLFGTPEVNERLASALREVGLPD